MKMPEPPAHYTEEERRIWKDGFIEGGAWYLQDRLDRFNQNEESGFPSTPEGSPSVDAEAAPRTGMTGND